MTESADKSTPDAALRQEQFLEVVDRDEAERRFRAALPVVTPTSETLPLAEVHGRVLAEDISSAVDVPGFDRSNVDGFAVRAENTYGASEEEPVRLTLTGEVLPTGVFPAREVATGQATPIATGAVVPRGADAVVMIEDTFVAEGAVVVQRSVTPGEHVSFAGTDIARGETVLRRGQRLTARETGVLAAIGCGQASVFCQPRVAILSTGDELMAPGTAPKPGMIYDSNATMLADMVRELGGQPVMMGIVPDDVDALRRVLRSALAYEMVLLSGGTSKGAGDVSYRVVGELGAPGIVVHGVALKPGKPLCLAVVEQTPIAVLPGFPTSAVFTFREMLGPLLRQLAGQPADESAILSARLPVRINSARGRTEYCLVSLLQTEAGWSAYPLGKGSGSVTTFSHADGYVTIPRNSEYLDADQLVEVRLLAPEVRPADLVVVGSHCLGMDWLISQLWRRGVWSKYLAVGSGGGVTAVSRGECDLAGVHLLDEKTGRYNEPFTPAGAVCRTGYRRRQGIVYRIGDDRFEGKAVADAIQAALTDPTCRMINRNRGSGTRVLIDGLLSAARPDGYTVEVKSHHAVAAAVAQGRADWGMAVQIVAEQSGLGFLPHRDEHYDFLVPQDRLSRPAVQAFFDLLAEPETRAALSRLGCVISG